MSYSSPALQVHMHAASVLSVLSSFFRSISGSTLDHHTSDHQEADVPAMPDVRGSDASVR